MYSWGQGHRIPDTACVTAPWHVCAWRAVAVTRPTYAYSHRQCPTASQKVCRSLYQSFVGVEFVCGRVESDGSECGVNAHTLLRKSHTRTHGHFHSHTAVHCVHLSQTLAAVLLHVCHCVGAVDELWVGVWGVCDVKCGVVALGEREIADLHYTSSVCTALTLLVSPLWMPPTPPTYLCEACESWS